MSEQPTGEVVVHRLVQLARQQDGEVARERERLFVLSMHERLQQRRSTQRRRRRVTVGAMALAASLCLVGIGVQLNGRAPLSYQITDGVLANGFIQGKEGTRVRFSDGSEVQLAQGARAKVEEVTAHGALVELGEGQVSVDIVKAQGNAWFVQAGPFRVHVTGTAFDVRWATAERRVEVALHRGSVIVTGPPINGRLTLQPGQRLVSTQDGSVTVTRLAPAQLAAAKPAPEPALAQPEVTVTFDEATGAADARLERRPEGANALTGWARLVAQGKFQTVIDEARRRGIDQLLTSGSLAELSALADAARYARNTQLARQVLLSERKRFPRSAAARDSAFFLGGIETEGSAAALAWYERYLAESPRGPYAPQALGRRMMILYRQRGREASVPLAEQYLARFPKGPYASAARKMLDRSPQ